MTNQVGRVRRALISVYDKSGLETLARGLQDAGVALIASGGTAARLRSWDIPHEEVSAFTGADEVLGGRVKTLHPKIHAGILADRRQQSHLEALEAAGYAEIDLVVCNLYPFEAALEAGQDRAALIENIDIGGPTLVRAAAKNCDGGVSVLSDPADYAGFMVNLRAGAIPESERRRLAGKAFALVARYDAAIANWTTLDGIEAKTTQASPGGMKVVADDAEEGELPVMLPAFRRQATLRYGENPHQPGYLYVCDAEPQGVAWGEPLQGKALSYNNYLDLDAAYRAAWMLDGPGCAIVKHTNPCGLAEASEQSVAFEAALAGDPLSAFGGIIGFNRSVQGATAEAIIASKLFVECIAAPDFTPEARHILQKRANLRLVKVPAGSPHPTYAAHRIGGGMLVQACDDGVGDPASWDVVTKRDLEPGWREELAFAMRASAVLKSNSIALTRGRRLLGAGAGFMSRVDALEQALKKAGDTARGAFLGSDAFFPFDDCVKIAAAAGVVAIAQPGGSKRDADSIAACDAAGMAMVFTGRRHFRH